MSTSNPHRTVHARDGYVPAAVTRVPGSASPAHPGPQVWH